MTTIPRKPRGHLTVTVGYTGFNSLGWHFELLKSEKGHLMPKFQVGQKVEHERWGVGRIVEVYAIAQSVDEETEYRVKVRGERYPAHLSENNLRAA